MANKIPTTPENKRRPNPATRDRGALPDDGAINDDLDDDLPPYAAGEEIGDEDDLLSDEDLISDERDDYRGAGKREN